MKTGKYVQSTFMSNSDLKYFDKMYDEKLLERGGEKILFADLKEIVLGSNKPDKTTLNESLDRVKKKLRENGGVSDNELFISKTSIFISR